MKRSFATTLGLSFLLLAGCKHGSGIALKNPGPAPLPAGWTLASDAETGVSVGLPGGWRVGVPRMIEPQSTAPTEEGAPTNQPMDPAIAQLSQGMQAESEAAEKQQLAKMREKDGIVLHAVDGSKPTIAEEPTRLYVKYIKDAGWSDLDEAGHAEASSQHREMEKQIVDLPVGKAMRLSAQGRNRIGDEECHVNYLFLDGNDAYVLRFSSTNNPSAILSIEKDVAQTFRLVAKKK